MKILIFTEGTIIMHKNARGHSRKEIVEQVKNKEVSVHDYSTYIPVGKAVEKLKKWKDQGAELLYLTSRKKPQEIEEIKKVLSEYQFPEGELYFRVANEEYKDVAERLKPTILIEDDCESIGGTEEMTITHIDPQIKAEINSVPIKEFGGIDHLPDKISDL